MTDTAPQPSPQQRSIGFPGATAIVAGSMLGVGIFLTPRLVAEQVDSTGLYLLLWACGGLVALAGAVAYAELGAMLPRAGGDYAYLRHAFGPSTGFAGGWLLFAGVFCGSISSMAAAVCQFQLPVLLAPFADMDFSATLVAGLSATQCSAVILVLFLTALNCVGVRISTGLQMLVTLVPFLVLTLVAVYALATAPHASARPVVETATAGGVSWMGIAVAFLSVYFAYAGWNAVAYVGGEIERPERNIPRSLLLGTGLVTLLYLVLCAAFVAVLGLGGIREAFEVGTVSATTLLGPRAEIWVAGLIAVALLGSINATVLQGSRIAFAMARDQALHPSLGRLSRRSAVPVWALVAQGLVTCLLIATGTFETLIELTSIAMFVMGGLTVGALFVLRRREPERPRPYRATGYPWLPALYLLVSLVVIGLKSRQVWIATRERSELMTWLPLLGLVLFVVVLVGHLAISRSRRLGA